MNHLNFQPDFKLINVFCINLTIYFENYVTSIMCANGQKNLANLKTPHTKPITEVFLLKPKRMKSIFQKQGKKQTG
jgi:hypothetical protein